MLFQQVKNTFREKEEKIFSLNTFFQEQCFSKHKGMRFLFHLFLHQWQILQKKAFVFHLQTEVQKLYELRHERAEHFFSKLKQP